MNRKGKGRGRQRGWQFAVVLLLAALLGLAAGPEFSGKERAAGTEASGQEGTGNASRESADGQPGSFSETEGLTVHYLDVEKCNCVLVRSQDGHFMLIDAGSNDDAHTVLILEYLKKQGVEELDYLLLTHPHRDHIRAVPQILDHFTVNEVLMGGFAAETVGTKTYQRVMEALEAKDPLRTRPEPGETYALGNASFTIIAHDDSEQTALEELNNCSIGLILTDGCHRFLFYGDGEEEMEEKLQNSGFALSCDVMMVAHHGSKSSTKKKTLQAVQPQIAVISCGIDGDGKKQEPSPKVLTRLEEAGVTVYRTDLDGTVVVRSTAEGLFVETGQEKKP